MFLKKTIKFQESVHRKASEIAHILFFVLIFFLQNTHTCAHTHTAFARKEKFLSFSLSFDSSESMNQQITSKFPPEEKEEASASVEHLHTQIGPHIIPHL